MSFAKFLRIPFLQNTSDDCFWTEKSHIRNTVTYGMELQISVVNHFYKKFHLDVWLGLEYAPESYFFNICLNLRDKWDLKGVQITQFAGVRWILQT